MRLNKFHDDNNLAGHAPVNRIRIIDMTGGSTNVANLLEADLRLRGFQNVSKKILEARNIVLTRMGFSFEHNANIKALRSEILLPPASVAGPSGATVTAGPSTSSGATGFGPPSSSAGASGVNPSLLSDFDTVGSRPLSHLGPPPLRHLGPILQPHELDHLKLSDDLFTGISPLSLPELGSSTFNVLD